MAVGTHALARHDSRPTRPPRRRGQPGDGRARAAGEGGRGLERNLKMQLEGLHPPQSPLQRPRTLRPPSRSPTPPLWTLRLFLHVRYAQKYFFLFSSVSPTFIPSYLTDGGVKRDPGSLAPDVNVLDVGPGAGTLCLAPGSTLSGRATWPILPSFLPFCLPPHPPARPRARPRRRCHPHPPPSRPLLAPPSPPLLTPPCHAHEHFGNSATSILPPSVLLLTRARAAGSADAGDPDAAARHHQ